MATPAGGQSDCLWLLPLRGDYGDVRLNRAGTIQVLQRFDADQPGERPTRWETYLISDPRQFLARLVGRPPACPRLEVAAATPVRLTYRVLIAIAATAFMGVRPIEIHQGYFDTSGYGGGHNRLQRPQKALGSDSGDDEGSIRWPF